MKSCNLWLFFILSVTCFSSCSGSCYYDSFEEPFRCGGGDAPEFSYPFGRRNSGCGDPLLQLHCDGNSNMTLLDINGTQYYLLEAPTYNYDTTYGTTHSRPIDFYDFMYVVNVVMTIVEKQLMGKECDPSSSNAMQLWSGDQLRIVNSKNITLGEGCQYDHQYFLNRLGCNATFFYSTTSDMSWTRKCKSQVQLPLRHDLDAGYIKDGFQIEWKPSNSCRQCMSDGGTCSYKPYIASKPFFCDRRDLPETPDYFGSKRKVGVGVIAGVAGGIAILLIFVVLLLVAILKRVSSSASKMEKFLKDFTHEMPTRYSYSKLKKITNNMAEKLGEGGFGVVYKGKLSNGNLVAVKILDQSRQSESQFMNEVATIGRIHHVHLVRLLGYCFERSRSALVYEYMANGSLEKFVFAKKETPQILSGEQFYSIALGAARGIAYLHEECERRIIHFDIKPHNVLLDADFTPKISDFGLAKLCGRLDDHISITAARGTPGYVAPELWSRNLGPITDKADVYSFGMLLLEMVGGRKNIDVHVSRSSEVYFPDWAFKLLENGELEERLTGRTGEEIESENGTQLLRMCKVGFWCIQYNSVERPTMNRVVQMLEGSGDEVSNPPFPFNSSASPEAPLMASIEESSSM